MSSNVSINQNFPNSEFHHLHINNQHHLGLYIPRELHREHSHNNWSRNEISLRDINNAALLWLCEQSTIIGDHFYPYDEEKIMKKSPQVVSKGSNNNLKVFIKSRYVEDLKLKGGERFCMKKGRGRRLIIEFDCEEDE